LPPEQQPNVTACAGFRRIAIVNSDTGPAADSDSAIEQAHLAANELLRQN